MASSPTQRSLQALRADGWRADVVERWIPGANIRKDLWDFVDILCMRDGSLLAVQCTSASNVSSRVKKITEHPLLAEVRKCGVGVEVWGWRKDTKGKWVVRKVDLS